MTVLNKFLVLNIFYKKIISYQVEMIVRQLFFCLRLRFFICNTTIPDYIKHTSDTNTYFGFPSDDTLTVITVGTERIRIENRHTTIPDYIKQTSEKNTYFGFPSDDTLTVTTLSLINIRRCRRRLRCRSLWSPYN